MDEYTSNVNIKIDYTTNKYIIHARFFTEDLYILVQYYSLYSAQTQTCADPNLL